MKWFTFGKILKSVWFCILWSVILYHISWELVWVNIPCVCHHISPASNLHVHRHGTGVRHMIYDVDVMQRKRHIIGVAYGSLQQWSSSGRHEVWRDLHRRQLWRVWGDRRMSIFHWWATSFYGVPGQKWKSILYITYDLKK